MVKTNGLDKFIKRLDEISNNAEEISGTHNYSFDEVFSEKFMKSNTDQTDIYEFINGANLDVNNQSEFEKITETDEWNEYVNNHSKFDSWKAMFESAVHQMMTEKLFK
ncbi:hypothetical protein BU036_09190 [Staphylococcus simulans]|uniref:hypothetical protein n=1 Tax=Staphylococcus simulans TaxID=1286 RepID=UPI000D09C171|nr:hypothetical protein [Staphylococcus simulans]AVO02337.1 hypothetical protein BI282_07945 [Staphylococcus simulans]AVO05283.1 hypothetical protein BI283_07910 [Staphylococcus simulans]AWG18886.1 hypothetical protein A9958_07955 [Staphylococcus simulans]AWI01833.1 hypothetical protein A7X73_07840 [Staphylococcus simulans]PTI99619.1 hypothetical protein BU048_06290 [Staphylococcus simulans]